ncbi:uncharacterized protein CLUP02_15951 [Colletotrichum lupini]|uniref:Uncharacterized protein n=1 Tax=Colletotrichum lupini TaxID=145971 RepID=A0A9Q8T706_9PEZI|nr:uncharacterized protein CLUP02_15951 [Colletotrichum lupini]UQC90421.1 hypothetical protein CLUP02_15951 [Colletotrichum lupini]
MSTSTAQSPTRIARRWPQEKKRQKAEANSGNHSAHPGRHRQSRKPHLFSRLAPPKSVHDPKLHEFSRPNYPNRPVETRLKKKRPRPSCFPPPPGHHLPSCHLHPTSRNDLTAFTGLDPARPFCGAPRSVFQYARAVSQVCPGTRFLSPRKSFWRFNHIQGRRQTASASTAGQYSTARIRISTKQYRLTITRRSLEELSNCMANLLHTPAESVVTSLHDTIQQPLKIIASDVVGVGYPSKGERHPRQGQSGTEVFCKQFESSGQATSHMANSQKEPFPSPST